MSLLMSLAGGCALEPAAPASRSTVPAASPHGPSTTAPGALEADVRSRAAAPREDQNERAPLVDVTTVAPTIRLDLRYATPDNFTGRTVYPAARCLLRAPVAAALARVQARLAADDVGLAVWDCYRPFSVQQRFWALVPDERYVARPVARDGVPVEGSRHNRGAAVDVTLVDAHGRPLPMPTGFDDFSVRAHRDATTWTPAARRNAGLLEAAMLAEGFTPLPTEWWHYDGPAWERYDLLDVPLR